MQRMSDMLTRWVYGNNRQGEEGSDERAAAALTGLSHNMPQPGASSEDIRPVPHILVSERSPLSDRDSHHDHEETVESTHTDNVTSVSNSEGETTESRHFEQTSPETTSVSNMTSQNHEGQRPTVSVSSRLETSEGCASQRTESSSSLDVSLPIESSTHVIPERSDIGESSVVTERESGNRQINLTSSRSDQGHITGTNTQSQDESLSDLEPIISLQFSTEGTTNSTVKLGFAKFEHLPHSSENDQSSSSTNVSRDILPQTSVSNENLPPVQHTSVNTGNWSPVAGCSNVQSYSTVSPNPDSSSHTKVNNPISNSACNSSSMTDVVRKTSPELSNSLCDIPENSESQLVVCDTLTNDLEPISERLTSDLEPCIKSNVNVNEETLVEPHCSNDTSTTSSSSSDMISHKVTNLPTDGLSQSKNYENLTIPNVDQNQDEPLSESQNTVPGTQSEDDQQIESRLNHADHSAESSQNHNETAATAPIRQRRIGRSERGAPPDNDSDDDSSTGR